MACMSPAAGTAKSLMPSADFTLKKKKDGNECDKIVTLVYIAWSQTKDFQ